MTKEEYSRLDEIMNADDQLFAKLVEETQRDNKSNNESKEELLKHGAITLEDYKRSH